MTSTSARLTTTVITLVLVVFGAINESSAQNDDAPKKSKKKTEKKKDSDELTLEKIFPKKSMFGTRASSASLSADGRYGAYLYRPYNERRHGSDLWVYDFQTGKSSRLTSVSVMAPFHKSVREVQEERVKKAKAKSKDKDGDKAADEKPAKKQKKSKADQQTDDQKENGDWVSKDDADNEKGKRYRGISSFVWHPSKNQMIFSSGGDLFHMENLTGEPVRLTATDAGERQVRFLKDGSGYTYSSNDFVYRVKFGSHLIEQISPRLSGNLNVENYSLSPDAKHLVLTASTGSVFRTSERTVNIIKYRNRFAEVDKVNRSVSDDELKPQDRFVYFYNIENEFEEKSELVEIYKQKVDEPRDGLSTPQWSPDSQAITFSTYDNKTSQFHVLMATVPEMTSEKETPKKKKAKAKPKNAKEKKKTTEASSPQDEDEKSDKKKSDEPDAEVSKAKVVYRALHFGGPTTPPMIRPQFAWNSRHIVFVSEQSGFRHVHMLDPLYQSVKQITSGNYEVYPSRMSDDHKHLFVSATKDNATQTNIFRINLETGEMKRIGKQDGAYSNIAVSNDGTRALANYVTFGKLSELVAIKGTQTKTVTDSHPEKAKKLTSVKPEFFTYENRNGQTIQAMMFKPKGFNKKKKRPLLIYVYGGPLGTRKTVVDGSYSTASYFFQRYMAEVHGYLTVCIDPRGVSGYGGLFEKANFQQVGKPQVEDLQDGVEYLIENYGVDKEKVGIHGWSFGGFQTQMCLFTAPETFQVGIAGAGPTEWENYNQWYTSGTIGDSEKGKADLKKFSLRPLAKNLEGKLLLVHGMEDSNVLFQDTIAVYRELLQAGKEAHVDLFLDPTGGHGLGGDVKTINRYRKYEEYLLRTLGTQKK
jgi:dipeptidyl aminopeptidase/acylaminoacyl peptidase